MPKDHPTSDRKGFGKTFLMSVYKQVSDPVGVLPESRGVKTQVVYKQVSDLVGVLPESRGLKTRGYVPLRTSY